MMWYGRANVVKAINSRTEKTNSFFGGMAVGMVLALVIIYLVR